MNENAVIDRAIGYIEKLFEQDCSGHDVGHTMRVYRNACAIADTEPGSDRFVVALAALLHDADDHKLFQTENNQNARAFLAGEQIGDALAARICRVINGISFSKNRGLRPDSLEGKIVQDADRLDAMGAIGIAWTFAFGGQKNRPMAESVQHFYDKLLLLKDEMNTDAGKRMAESRHSLMAQFLEELEKDMKI